MREPIRSGDLCIIIGGLNIDNSPNAGKIVTVKKFAGDHAYFGKVWLVSGAKLITQHGEEVKELHVAEAWLKKIEPPKPKVETKKEDTVEA